MQIDCNKSISTKQRLKNNTNQNTIHEMQWLEKHLYSKIFSIKKMQSNAWKLCGTVN